ncbi:hypothetical protein [Flavobacterium sp. FlaQc-48]|uniref:hypothetical protein n=1 Tax=Flavobacterium sp. FlaQc-48 TaxID=3374181 RepID=UPI0037580E1B
MNTKKIILHVLIRIGTLVLLIGSVFLLWYLTFDPHKNCDENGHRHVDGGLGMFIMAFLAAQMFYLGLLIEMIYLFVKKKQNLAFTNLGFLIISLCIALAFIYLIN